MTDLRTPGAAKQPPHRYRLTVPHADEAVIAWLELQDNQSLSIRVLIRESIARQGYVDIVNRPVVQLPAGRERPVDSISVEAFDAGPEETTRAPADPGAAQENPPASAPVDVNHLFAQLRR